MKGHLDEGEFRRDAWKVWIRDFFETIFLISQQKVNFFPDYLENGFFLINFPFSIFLFYNFSGEKKR